MLWALVVVLFVLWLMFFVGNVVVGGLVHLLLVAALIAFLIRPFTGRTPSLA